jgi:hypothetical protein
MIVRLRKLPTIQPQHRIEIAYIDLWNHYKSRNIYANQADFAIENEVLLKERRNELPIFSEYNYILSPLSNC